MKKFSSSRNPRSAPGKSKLTTMDPHFRDNNQPDKDLFTPREREIKCEKDQRSINKEQRINDKPFVFIFALTYVRCKRAIKVLNWEFIFKMWQIIDVPFWDSLKGEFKNKKHSGSLWGYQQ